MLSSSLIVPRAIVGVARHLSAPLCTSVSRVSSLRSLPPGCAALSPFSRALTRRLRRSRRRAQSAGAMRSQSTTPSWALNTSVRSAGPTPPPFLRCPRLHCRA
eukprot:2493093-Rhodomonas_salina.2